METVALHLLTDALAVAMLLALPVVAVIAAAGIVIGLAQTVVQVQDQNVAFAPKLALVALLIALGGPAAVTLLRELLMLVVRALPGLAA